MTQASIGNSRIVIFLFSPRSRRAHPISANKENCLQARQRIQKSVQTGSHPTASPRRHVAMKTRPTPACYDVELWGRGNDNLRCHIEPNPTDELVSRQGNLVPRFKMIHTGQIRTTPQTNFFEDSIFIACANAGTPVILMLNPEWLRHADIWSLPNMIGLSWTYKRTSARQLAFGKTLKGLLPELGESIR